MSSNNVLYPGSFNDFIERSPSLQALSYSEQTTEYSQQISMARILSPDIQASRLGIDEMRVRAEIGCVVLRVDQHLELFTDIAA